MASEPARVFLKLSNDPRLVAGVGAAVAHVAEEAGFDARSQADLVAATEEACRETLPLLADANARLCVYIECFADRIEVTLEHPGQARPIAGLDSFAFPRAQEVNARGLSGLALLARVDRILYNACGGISRMTLVKYLGMRPGKE